MSNNPFLKSECRHCGGHLEFAADAAGATIACPHCGQSTELIPPVLPNEISRKKRMLPPVALAVMGGVIGLAVLTVFLKKTARTVATEPPAVPVVPSNSLPALVLASDSDTADAIEERTNDFAISVIKLEKTPGSSLVYVTGKIRNLNSRQRFGVKIELELLNTNNLVVGRATDYHPLLEPQSDWRFRALVMESKVTSVRFKSILEDSP